MAIRRKSSRSGVPFTLALYRLGPRTTSKIRPLRAWAGSGDLRPGANHLPLAAPPACERSWWITGRCRAILTSPVLPRILLREFFAVHRQGAMCCETRTVRAALLILSKRAETEP